MRKNKLGTTTIAAAAMLGGVAFGLSMPATADNGPTNGRPLMCSTTEPCEPGLPAKVFALQWENGRLHKALDKAAARHERYVRALTTPCRLEDSSTCYWEAHERGNGKGTTFVSVGQRYFYLGGAR